MTILESFKTMLGSGRAWRLVADNIQNTVRSLLQPIYDLREIGMRVMMTPFPTLNTSAGDDLTSDLTSYESQFGVNNPPTATDDRATLVEAQWGMVGAQGYGYIENVLKASGLDVTVQENFPVVDLSSTGKVQYGIREYGQNQYGQGSYQIIGNGNLSIAGSIKDPVILKNSSKCFIVERASALNDAQYQNLVDLILQIKPMETVCVIKIKG